MTMGEDRVVAVVRAPAIRDASRLAEALLRAGIRCQEFTLDSEGALDALASAAQVGAVVGAGTVLNAEQAEAAIAAGARFLVSPVLEPSVLRVASGSGVPAIPGAMTPTEVRQADRLGAAAVKLFSARVFPPRYISDLLAVFPGVRLIPSGGLNESNSKAYLRAGAHAISSGTTTIPPSAIREGHFSEIESRARQLIAGIRGAYRE
jgi:2-dehydro-3-deoxyphosphogluconate aldolase/(4S)-4-hydroxy-2-oxoglutarate aldolase